MGKAKDGRTVSAVTCILGTSKLKELNLRAGHFFLFFFRCCSSYYHAVSTPLASNGLRFSVDLNELDGPSRAKKDMVFRVC